MIQNRLRVFVRCDFYVKTREGEAEKRDGLEACFARGSTDLEKTHNRKQSKNKK